MTHVLFIIERMLRSVISRGGEARLRESCMDARGLGNLELAEGAERSNMSKLARWTIESDRVLTF